MNNYFELDIDFMMQIDASGFVPNILSQVLACNYNWVLWSGGNDGLKLHGAIPKGFRTSGK